MKRTWIGQWRDVATLVLGLAGVALMAVPSALAQGPRQPAGYVTAVDAPDHEGKPGAVLRREGQDLDVQIWTSLFAGDVLEVHGAGTIVVETVKDKRLKLDRSRSPYQVEGALPAGGRMAEISALIGELFKSRPSNNATNLVGRSDPTLRFPLGANAVQRVVPGMTLWLGWQGGAAPFTAEVRGQTAKRKRDIGVLATTTGDSREAMLTLPMTAAGNLTLIIRDSAGAEVKTRLETASPPVIPSWVRAGAPTPEFALVAEALHLLERPIRSFDLMAAARAAEVQSYPPAAALLRQLAEGRKPR